MYICASASSSSEPIFGDEIQSSFNNSKGLYYVYLSCLCIGLSFQLLKFRLSSIFIGRPSFSFFLKVLPICLEYIFWVGSCSWSVKLTIWIIWMQCHVLYGSDLARDLQNLLEVDDIALIMNSKHRPRCIIEFISQSIRLLKLEDSRRNVLVSTHVEIVAF
jgi:hypothetical protein